MRNPKEALADFFEQVRMITYTARQTGLHVGQIPVQHAYGGQYKACTFQKGFNSLIIFLYSTAIFLRRREGYLPFYARTEVRQCAFYMSSKNMKDCKIRRGPRPR